MAKAANIIGRNIESICSFILSYMALWKTRNQMTDRTAGFKCAKPIRFDLVSPLYHASTYSNTNDSIGTIRAHVHTYAFMIRSYPRILPTLSLPKTNYGM